MQRNVTALAVASACLMFSALQARAAGFALHEQGISGLGNAYAGAAAVAEDDTTVWWNPAVSFKVSDAVSVGGGISYQHGKVDLTTAVNYSAAAFAVGGAPALGAVGGPGVEGQNKTSVDGDAWGFNLGALFNILPTTRL